MGILEALLIVATLLCTLVSGFLFAFAVVVMPGIKTLRDSDFIRAFQVMDDVIQKNHPLFMLVWVGSAIAVLAAAGFGVAQLDGSQRLLLILAAALYLFAVQMPTIIINLPLNNRLQTLDVDAMSEADCRKARADFEPRWNRANTFRTLASTVASILLMIVLLWA